ncbi:hypothetical protein [Marinobacter oulmenensis]|uniref:Uncharacterized protein n=1 Tax=Marinobacter oulmenensis TaxID=643747 RepID=A0A840UHN8_9GAMM|nr:hypothetical protein [Marinobacter oulmenensis]MBB5320318.1 hypothetical protein [Marinobacter oulmenensis]
MALPPAFNPCFVVAAIARELVGHIWAVAREVVIAKPDPRLML